MLAIGHDRGFQEGVGPADWNGLEKDHPQERVYDLQGPSHTR